MNIAPLFVVVHDPAATLPPRIDQFLKARAHASGLGRLYEGNGVVAFGDPAAPHLQLRNSAGLIWGVLFDRTTDLRVTDPEQIESTNGSIANLAERQWGGFLSIRQSGRLVEVYRDPSGSIPCYHFQVDGAEVFTTRPAMFVDAGLLRAEIEWTLLTQALVYRDLRPARTPLRGVSEVQPGTAVRFDDGLLRVETVWSPWRFTGSEMGAEAADKAIERVQRAVTNCVGAWGRCFNRPLIEISGGLDSSIIAAVLAQADVGSECVTFAPSEGDPDETPYARAATEYLGLRLEVLRANVADVDLRRTQARDLPRPAARCFTQAHDVQLRSVGAKIGADAFFSGGGGDNVFAYLKSVLPVIDRWKRGGGGVLATMTDMAALAEVSLWEVVAQSIKRLIRLRAVRKWAGDERFLDSRALHDLPFPQDHPWIDAPAHVLPGKRVHGHSMIVIQNHLEGFDRLQDAPIISPLMSQPIVETCMAIPTWVWCEGGMNRAIARKAFAERLPSAVIERRTKGAFDSYCAKVFVANRGTVRDMLLGGALAGQGLLDLSAIEMKLANDVADRSDMVRLLDLVDAEAWVGAWASRSSSQYGL
ncbi:asparagine synthase-related protein [Sphingomonas sp. PB4P5]|uniref:asparagine synthase-related protein n=1 Tax=Parasphingomonas puruogangriensis TaxID=3096155 RepID=UPI002FC73167